MSIKLKKKSFLLIKEAEKDIEIGCYNKAVTAAYFSARMVAEDFLKSRIKHLPRRDDKLANTLKALGFTQLAEKLLLLYDQRKKADYGEETISKTESLNALLHAREILEQLTSNTQT